MVNERQIQYIPATVHALTHIPNYSLHKRKVAGYARVSTDSEEQKTSYDAQVDYYTSYIRSKEDWEFVKVYTDEGISGTNIKHRQGFNQMVEDALDGKIDLIITKSVSRFARNTVDSLTTVRLLKDSGVEIFFEKENIWTFDSKGELLITIMSSLAQEESRSISENITWGQRKRFADGKINLPYKQFLGYKKGANDLPEIVEEEAEIVRLIFRLFIGGKTPGAIANELTERGIPSPSGKAKWVTSTIESMLQNEKYRGSAILQKEYTVDFLTKKRAKNNGEVPQYYIEFSHPAIIEPKEFDAVQLEIKRRKAIGRAYSSNSVFSSKIICGDCGHFYGSKVWHSNSKYKRTIYQCNNKFNADHNCKTPHLDESIIKDAFIRAYNKLISDKDKLLHSCRIMQKVLTDTTEIDVKIQTITDELQELEILVKQLIATNKTFAMNQSDYAKKYANLENRFKKAEQSLKQLQKQKTERADKAENIGGFMFAIREYEIAITEFSEELWLSTVDCVVVEATGKMIFKFRCGKDITV